jgi:hypothetical protein
LLLSPFHRPMTRVPAPSLFHSRFPRALPLTSTDRVGSSNKLQLNCDLSFTNPTPNPSVSLHMFRTNRIYYDLLTLSLCEQRNEGGGEVRVLAVEVPSSIPPAHQPFTSPDFRYSISSLTPRIFDGVKPTCRSYLALCAPIIASGV